MKCLECNRLAGEDYMIDHKGQIFCCDDCKATYYEDREEEPENHPYYSDYYAIREPEFDSKQAQIHFLIKCISYDINLFVDLCLKFFEFYIGTRLIKFVFTL